MHSDCYTPLSQWLYMIHTLTAWFVWMHLPVFHLCGYVIIYWVLMLEDSERWIFSLKVSILTLIYLQSLFLSQQTSGDTHVQRDDLSRTLMVRGTFVWLCGAYFHCIFFIFSHWWEPRTFESCYSIFLLTLLILKFFFLNGCFPFSIIYVFYAKSPWYKIGG
jgi:hypothetical protein